MTEDKLKRDYIRLPNSSAQPEYVYNKVKQTVSGHREEVDDTPGNERLFRAHKSGSYTEISSDGKVVDVAVGNRHEYTKGSRAITVDGFDDVIVQGGKLIVKGGYLVEVVGQYDITAAGDINIIVAGDAKIVCENATVSSSDSTNINCKNLNIDASEEINMKSKKFTSKSGETVVSSDGKTSIGGSTTSISGETYLGQDSLGGTDGQKVVTEAGPSSTVKAKV